MKVPTLQQLLFQKIPMETLLENNLIHLFGPNNRFVMDYMNSANHQAICAYFLRSLLDQGNTSFYWVLRFFNKKIHHLPMNTVVCACWQEHYSRDMSMIGFAMRTDSNHVAILIYTMPKKQGKTLIVPLNTHSILNQTYSHDWTNDDWTFISTLTFDHAFVVSSRQIV